MAKPGYLKLHRSILEWEWYHDLPVRVLFLHLLVSVNYEEKRWMGQLVLPGQLITSLPQLSQQCGLSVKEVRTALKKLASTGEIVDEGAVKWRVVTLQNWAKWQGDASEGAGSGQARGRQGAGSGQARGRQGAATEEGKKERREEGKNLDAEASASYGDPAINAVTDKLKEVNGGMLDGTIRANRRDAATLLRRMAKSYPDQDPIRLVNRLIDLGKADAFHARNLTSFRYLLDHGVRIAESANRQPATRNGNRPTSTERLQQDLQSGRFDLEGAAVSGPAGGAQEDASA